MSVAESPSSGMGGGGVTHVRNEVDLASLACEDSSDLFVQSILFCIFKVGLVPSAHPAMTTALKTSVKMGQPAWIVTSHISVYVRMDSQVSTL